MTRWIVIFILMGNGGYLFGASDTLINKNESTKAVIAASKRLNGDSGIPSMDKSWNFHIQNTYIGQGDAAFPAKYSGPNSLNSHGEFHETATLDFFAGARLWHGAEAHIDFLTWQGFGLSQTFGMASYPNGDAYKSGTDIPNYSIARLFIRQTIGLGGEPASIRSRPSSVFNR